MADPFTDTVETLAPSRPTTSFFSNPSDSDVITRRWASGQALQAAQMEREAAQGLADTASRLEKSRLERAAAGRQKLLWGREDEEYEERQNYKATRGETLKALAGINPEQPDYLERRAELLAGLPMFVKEDDAVAAIMAANDSRYQRFEAETARREDMDTRFRNSVALAERNDVVKAALKGLPPERLQQLRDPVTGELDVQRAMFEAGEIESKRKISEAAAKGAMKPAASLSKEQKLVRDTALTTVESDPAAFRRPMDNLIKQWQTKKGLTRQPTEEELRKEFPDTEVTYAKEWKPEFEFPVARETSRQEYIDAGGKDTLNDFQKAKRGAVWDAANGEGQFEAPAAAPAGGKPLTREAAAKFKEQAKGDRAEAERLAREAGYTF